MSVNLPENVYLPTEANGSGRRFLAPINPANGTPALLTAKNVAAGADGLDHADLAVAASGLGETTDAIVAAGAAGSVSAKLRRVTQALDDLKTTIVLAAGSAILGKVGIDQTTPGTTDSVSVATGQGAGATIGTAADAVVAAGAAGSLSAKLRRVTQGLDDLKTAIVLGAGTNAIGKLAANSGVDIGDTDVTSIVPGTGATNLGKAEDAAHASGDTGVMALAVRQDTAAQLAGTDGDYAPLIVGATGRLHVVNMAPETVTLLSSAARTGNQVSAAITNYGHRGIYIYLNVTAYPGSGNIIVYIEQLMEGTATYGNFMVGPTVAATGRYMMLMYPGATTATVDVKTVYPWPLPRTFKVSAYPSDTAASWTYSLAYTLLP